MLDAHCHLDRYPDPMLIATEAAARGVFIVAVTNLPTHFRAGLAHARGLKGVRLALGLHPLAVGTSEHEISQFRALLARTSFVGEVGLDFSREGIGTKDVQLRAFREVAAAVRDAGPKFVSLHSRRAETAVLDVLSEYGITQSVFHWFSGSTGALTRVVEAGHFLSVNPAMTLSVRGQELVARMPRDRVLTETDGPYTRIGSTACAPWQVQVVEQYLASVWGVTEAAVRDQVWANFRGLTGRIQPGSA